MSASLSPESAAELEQLRERVAEHGASPMEVGPQQQPVPVNADPKAPWGRAEDGRPFLPMGAHWTDIPELVDWEVASIRARVGQAQGGGWYIAPAAERGLAPGTVRTRVDGYQCTVGQFTNVLPADLELILRAHGDLSWCLDMIDKLRARVAELEAAPVELTIYRAEYESFVFGLYTTAAAAREHCETHERRDQPTATFGWIEDEEDGVAELVATVGGEEKPTGYVVTALEVASAYDEEAGE